MTMTFSFTLTCQRCKATLHYENERPNWQTYDYRVERADDVERASQFVVEHADKPFPDNGQYPDWWPQDARSLPFVGTWENSRAPFGEPRLTLSIPDPYRYVPCPVCDARVKEPKP